MCRVEFVENRSNSVKCNSELELTAFYCAIKHSEKCVMVKCMFCAENTFRMECHLRAILNIN